jgi:hypothetical protein
MLTKSLLLPGDHRTGLDECQGGLPAGPQASKLYPEHPINRTKVRAMDGLLIDRDLMPQRQVFQAERCMGPEERDDESQQG